MWTTLYFILLALHCWEIDLFVLVIFIYIVISTSLLSISLTMPAAYLLYLNVCSQSTLVSEETVNYMSVRDLAFDVIYTDIWPEICDGTFTVTFW